MVKMVIRAMLIIRAMKAINKKLIYYHSWQDLLQTSQKPFPS